MKLTHADPFLSYDYNSTITVLVGKKERQFTVHKDTICAKSKFFKTACSERWSGLQSSEEKSKAIKLPETPARAFQAYVHWVYTSQVEVESAVAWAKHRDHLKLYILPDVLDDYQLRNTVTKLLIHSLLDITTQPGPSTIYYVYECTPVGSPLRKVLVDRKIALASRKEFASDVTEYHVEFVQEPAVALLDGAPLLSSRKELVASLINSFKPETGDVQD
jgi:hypothetical protein